MIVLCPCERFLPEGSGVGRSGLALCLASYSKVAKGLQQESQQPALTRSQICGLERSSARRKILLYADSQFPQLDPR